MEIINEENHKMRSNFIQGFVQNFDDAKSIVMPSVFAKKVPKRIVQFWDDLDRLPNDVKECMESWRVTVKHGFERLLFDKMQARDFIDRELGHRYIRAYDKCYHPAMKSDYFRLCYILVKGGCYIDADDEYNGSQMQHLFSDGRLKIQPLCYDTATHMMVPQKLYKKAGANSVSWIFYFNNNPLIAGSNHPIIERALSQATLSLERSITKDLPEIQSTTGPGNLTKSIYLAAMVIPKIEDSICVLSNWEDIARCKWELSYRNDNRNWRHSNCRSYPE